MRFSTTMEGLGVSLIDSVMTLIAFLPLLATLSVHVPELPLVGSIPYPLVIAALVRSKGASGLAATGTKLGKSFACSTISSQALDLIRAPSPNHAESSRDSGVRRA